MQKKQKFFHKNINKIIIPYEGQPFQNKLIQTISKKFKRVETIGYIHSPPMSMPANLIYRSTSPQKLFLMEKIRFIVLLDTLDGTRKKFYFYHHLDFSKENLK